MEQKTDIITLKNTNRFASAFFSAGETAYCQKVGRKILSVRQMECRYSPKPLSRLARDATQQGISALALPPDAAALLPRYQPVFAADGRLLALALFQEALAAQNLLQRDLLPGVEITLPEGRLLARLIAKAWPGLALVGGTPQQQAELAQTIYRESGLVVRSVQPDLLLRPPTGKSQPNQNPGVSGILTLDTPEMESEAGTLPAYLAEALLITAMNRSNNDILQFLQQLRRKAYRCNYYSQYVCSKYERSSDSTSSTLVN